MTPDYGYQVMNVFVDGEPVDAVIDRQTGVSNYTFEDVSSDHSIHADFTTAIYTIKSTSGRNGDIEPKGNIPAEHGSNLTFTITPDSGHEIKDVVIDGESKGVLTMYEFTDITSDHTIHAIFTSACPAKVVSSDPLVLDELYQLRDNVFAHNKLGQELIHLYYQHSTEVADILKDNRILLIRSALILKEVMPGILFLVNEQKGEDIVINPLLITRVNELFKGIAENGSEELSTTLSLLIDRLMEYEGMRVSQIWGEISGEEPQDFVVMQNYPNPFNPETWIPYQLSEQADVYITIYNITGNVVRRLELGNKEPGYYIGRSKAAYWDGRDDSGNRVSSGVYFYQLKANRDISVGKMTILK
jgi:hypothetical protein